MAGAGMAAAAVSAVIDLRNWRRFIEASQGLALYWEVIRKRRATP